MLISYKQLLDKYNIRPTGVCHIGANSGQEANDYYTNGVDKTIWFEADPSLIPGLINNLQPYENRLVFNTCLTDKDDDEVTLNIANNGGQSSSIFELGIHKHVHPEVHYVNQIQVKTQRLDTMFKKYDIDIADYPFVNIDVQGAEGLVLQGMGKLLNKIKYLYLEVNDAELYEGIWLYPQIRDYLSDHGFYLKERIMCGNTQWGDAFFIKG